MARKPLARLLISVSVMLFTLQATRVAFSSLFGIIYDQIFEGPVTAWLGVSNVLLWISLLVPPILASKATHRWVYRAAALSAVARVALSYDLPDLRFYASLLLLAAGMFFLAGNLRHDRRLALSSLVVAAVADQVLRALGHTYDLSLRPDWVPVQAAWSLGVIAWLVILERRPGDESTDQVEITPWVGLGLGAWLFLETSLLAMPNAIARWADGSYALVAPALVFVTVAPWILANRGRGSPSIWQESPTRWGLSLVLVVGLMIGYFFAGTGATLALLAAQLAAMLALEALPSNSRQTQRAGSGWLALGALLFLLLNYFNAFAFTYPYTLPSLRQLGWQAYLAGGVGVGIGVSFGARGSEARGGAAGRRVQAALLAVAAIAIVAGAARPEPARPLPDQGALRLASYNIHYGYDDLWHFTLEAQAELIEQLQIDAIALQEVDTGRITSYGVDDAYYLARRLRMNVTYLPTVEHLTGIAVLHKGEPVWADSRWLTSLQEQTGVIGVGLPHDADPVAFFGIWLGLSNEDTERQIAEALDFVGDRTPAGFAGDFNAELGSPVIEAVQAAGFLDPFTALGLAAPPTSPALDPQKRIDYVWVRELLPVEAWVPESVVSDHRMVIAELNRLP